MTPPESKAKDAYGREECIHCGGWFDMNPDRISAVHICTPMVVCLKKELAAAKTEVESRTHTYKLFAEHHDKYVGALSLARGALKEIQDFGPSFDACDVAKEALSAIEKLEGK